MPDFRFMSRFPIADIVNAIQRKPVLESDIASQQQERELAKQKFLLDTLTTAATGASNAALAIKKQRMAEAMANYQKQTQAANSPVANVGGNQVTMGQTASPTFNAQGQSTGAAPTLAPPQADAAMFYGATPQSATEIMAKQQELSLTKSGQAIESQRVQQEAQRNKDMAQFQTAEIGVRTLQAQLENAARNRQIDAATADNIRTNLTGLSQKIVELQKPGFWGVAGNWAASKLDSNRPSNTDAINYIQNEMAKLQNQLPGQSHPLVGQPFQGGKITAVRLKK